MISESLLPQKKKKSEGLKKSVGTIYIFLEAWTPFSTGPLFIM